MLLAPSPCGTSPCIDQTVFGPTVADYYWSATTDATFPGFAWGVFFVGGDLDLGIKNGSYWVRGVRSGL